MAKRRNLDVKTDADWEALIKSCLHNSARTERWGCLYGDGNLFRIETLKREQVPMHVISAMESRGELTLVKEMGRNDRYVYSPVVRRKKRALA